LPAPVVVDPLQQLRTDIDRLLDQAGHLHGTWGVAVQSLTRNDRLYERHARTLMVSASTMKLVTIAVAAEAVGWDYRFETQLLATGPIVNGVLRGDLLIVGSGDPSILGRPDSRMSPPWVDALRAKGVSRIEGRVIGDDDAVDEPRPGFAWSWDDLGYQYGALPGALNLTENVTAVTVSPGTAPGLPTVIERSPALPEVPITNDTSTSPQGVTQTLWPEFRPGDAALHVRGTIPVGGPPAVVAAAVGNPTLWFARVVRDNLLSAGIDVSGEAIDADDLVLRPDREAATVIHTHRSQPLAEIAKPLVKNSINLYAEAVLWLATGREGPRSTAAGLDAVRLRLQGWGIVPEGIQIVDGSGLSRRNVIAPETLLALLVRFHDPSGASPWMQAQAVAGRDGTLQNRMKATPAEANAIGKTGAMSNVRGFAGYVRTADGEPLALAIIANNFEGPGSTVNATIDEVVALLAGFRRGAN
jgi:D-alanyl-D-alanine carboxypeptidase/D-alanyl-D-alanine-endopeptidase (penicillin-binding protein 4)